MTSRAPETTHGPGDRVVVLGASAGEGILTLAVPSLAASPGWTSNPLHAVRGQLGAPPTGRYERGGDALRASPGRVPVVTPTVDAPAQGAGRR